SKAIGEKNAGIALCADGSRELARIHAWRGHQLLKPTRRAIEPWLVKGADDLGDKDALAALPEAAERVDRGAVALPALRRIVCRHGLGGGPTEWHLGCLRQLAQRLERDRVGTFAELGPNPAAPLTVLGLQRCDPVAGLA